RYFAIDLDAVLRYDGQERAHHACNLLALLRRGHELVQVVRQELDVFPRAVFEHESESAGSADPGNGQRRKTQSESLRELRQFMIDVLQDLLILLLPALALTPVLESHEEESVVSGT